MHFRSLLIIFIVLSTISASMIFYIHHTQENIIHGSALENAKLISNALISFRTLYSSEVIETAQKFGIPITHDYQPGKSLPLPATLSIILGKKISETNNDIRVQLTSPYPFPWRRNEGELKDNFIQKSWNKLADKSQNYYYEITEQNGIETLRFVRADRMNATCVNCHNNHPDSPKKDWRTDDLRGLLEVTIPLNKTTLITHSDIKIAIIIFSILTLLGIYGLYRVFSVHTSYTSMLENEVKSRTQELENEKIKAEQASLAKSQFLSQMSHELRTPLNSVLGFSQLLQLDLDNDSQRDSCQQIITSGNHLLDLINEVLDLERIESGNINCQIEHVHIDNIIQESISLVRPLAHQRNIHILDYVNCNHQVLADKKHLKQVLINLISNAVKYNRKNGSIEIKSAVLKNGVLRISVIDTGSGLTREQQNRLFQPFERLDANEKCIEGIGIGLVITKQLVELMNGRIGIISNIDKGCTFWFELPVAN